MRLEFTGDVVNNFFEASTPYGWYTVKRLAEKQWEITVSAEGNRYSWMVLELKGSKPEAEEVCNSFDMDYRKNEILKKTAEVMGEEAVELLKAIPPKIDPYRNFFGSEPCCQGCGHKRKTACYMQSCCAILNPKGKMPSSKSEPLGDINEFFKIS